MKLEDLAAITNAQRDRILAALDNIRDLAYATAGAALKASRAVRMGSESDADQLAVVIGQCESNWKAAQAIARELN